MSRLAIVLFNLGGPDSLEAVRPFLRNLFSDPAIIAAPGPVRWLLARLISTRRASHAREIYRQIGGRSPLLPETETQARALEAALRERLPKIAEVRAFPCMRYWHPMSEAVARQVVDFAPAQVVLLPLYPQFSTATSRSSLTDWRRAAAAAGLSAPQRAVCCYPRDAGFIAAQAALIAPALRQAAAKGKPRLLLSAHGLPKKVIARGDPYQWQVEATCAAIVEDLATAGLNDIDWRTCYQSRVGPLEWIGPATDDEIERAGRDGVPVVLAPVAFVSEHSETLVELDIEYRELAGNAGVPAYLRVAAVGTEAAFIGGLAELVRDALALPAGVAGRVDGQRLCPAAFGQCGCGLVA
ncbi:MAG: ferrochelatase [Alphaproteobacteria bacterium]|jgi:ferrochelatase|nr:ferrochelatase [Alphaproteobacteria bacterium]MDP6565037.1 ferrochelatase [Alphaproteobacteria bacterium]MDP6816325.1 ferrochelatase [Alphaproteobacteria bacterium]